MLHDAKVLAAVGLNDDHVAFGDLKAGVVKQVEDPSQQRLKETMYSILCGRPPTGSNEEAVWTGSMYVLYSTYTSQSTRPECRKDDRVEQRMFHGPTTKASHNRGSAQCGVERVLLPDRGSPSLVTRNRSQEATKRVNEDPAKMLVVVRGEVG